MEFIVQKLSTDQIKIGAAPPRVKTRGMRGGRTRSPNRNVSRLVLFLSVRLR